MALAATGLKFYFSVALHLIAILPPRSGTNLEVDDAEDERRRERDVESELKL